MTEQNIVPYEQSRFLYKVSFLMFVSIFYSLYKKEYDICFNTSVLFCTSIHHWRNPKYDWKRVIDIIWVNYSGCYLIIKAYKSKYWILFSNLLIFVILSYLLAIYFGKKQLYWYSVYSHSMIHVLSNIANCILCFEKEYSSI